MGCDSIVDHLPRRPNSARNSMSSSSSSSASFEYVTPVDHNLLCPICQLPFSEPMLSVAGCEHVYCRLCILEHLRSSASSSTSCPCDRQPLHESQLVPAPRLIKLLCDELPVSCSGCRKWTGQRADWSRHTRVECIAANGVEDAAAAVKARATVCENGCGFQVADEDSSNNGVERKRRQLQQHHEQDCQKRTVRCEMCGHRGTAKDAEVRLRAVFSTAIPNFD